MDMCVVCHKRDSGWAPFWRGLKQCRECGHCVADLDMQEVAPTSIYGHEYFVGKEYADYLRDRPVFSKHFQDRLRDIERFQSNGTLVEIGCAYGLFLWEAQRTYRVQGFDIAEEPVRYAREYLNLDVRCEEFGEATVEPESADIVVMWDVIEHLLRPDLTIKQAARVLRPGGHLFLTTGDIGSCLARLRRERWRLIHPPTHLHYFSHRTITRLLEGHGIRTVQIGYVGVRRSVRQVAYSLLQLHREAPSRLYHLIANSCLGELSFRLNTYDIMLVVGRKGRSN